MRMATGTWCVSARRWRATREMRILNAAQMREADRRTIEDIGVPSAVLMENAGREAARGRLGREPGHSNADG